MTMEVSKHEVTNILPFCREELFLELVQKKMYGHIHKIWQYPGHLFVAVNDGHQLFTFDCKPITRQHAFDSGHLDMSQIPSPIVNIIMTTKDTALIICQSSHTYLFKFEPDATWSRLEEFDISSIDDPCKVISSCYIPNSQTLVWCQKSEQRSSNVLPQISSSGSQDTFCYKVCKKKIEAGGSFKQDIVDVIIYNSPPFEAIHLAEDIIFLTSSYDHEQVTCHVLFNVTNRALRILVGSYEIDKPLSSYLGPTDFQNLAQAGLHAFMKTLPGKGDLGIQYDSYRKQVGILSSSGELEMFSYNKNPREGSWPVTRRLQDVTPHLYPRPSQGDWFLARDCLGLLTMGNLHMVSLCDTTVVSELNVDTGQGITHGHTAHSTGQLVLPSHCPGILALVLTHSMLWALQTSNKRRGKEGAGQLSKDNFFQADILRLANLHQEKNKTFNMDKVVVSNHLHKTWTARKTVQGCSQLTQSVAPYLDEYWKLDQLSQGLIHMTLGPPDGSSPHPLVQPALAPTGESRAGHLARLLWLSNVAPQALLEHLCQGISLDCDTPLECELPAWCTVLGLDGGDLVHFEVICRLLFQLQPTRLVSFVKCAEAVSELTIGGSAFVRKKQSLMFFKSAKDSLPENNTSCDPNAAELARSQLIIASANEDRVGVALTHLLEAEQWAVALDLLSQAKQDSYPGLSGHLHTVTQAMARKNVLPEHINKILPILPSWKSFVTFADIASQKCSSQQHLSLSTDMIFAERSSNLQFSEAKPFLLDLINKTDML